MNEDLAELARRFGEGGPEARRVAVMDLAELAHEPGAEQILLQALHDSDASVRAQAAKILDEFPAENLTEALLDALNARDPYVRNGAAQSLANLKDPAAGPTLLASVERSQDAFVIAAALRALRNIAYTPALNAAVRLLEHRDSAVRQEAVGLLGYLRDPATLQIIGAMLLSDPEPEVRRYATAALIGGCAEIVAPFLLHALEDESWQVRAESAHVLGRLQITPAVSALIRATEDSAWQVREKAAQALGSLRAPEGLAALGCCASDPISNLRKAALAALGEIAEPQARQYLEPALQDTDPDVRKLARWALEQLPAAT